MSHQRFCKAITLLYFCNEIYYSSYRCKYECMLLHMRTSTVWPLTVKWIMAPLMVSRIVMDVSLDGCTDASLTSTARALFAFLIDNTPYIDIRWHLFDHIKLNTSRNRFLTCDDRSYSGTTWNKLAVLIGIAVWYIELRVRSTVSSCPSAFTQPIPNALPSE